MSITGMTNSTRKELIDDSQKEPPESPLKAKEIIEYHNTLRHYIEDLPEVMFDAGMTHEEVSFVVSALKGENLNAAKYFLQTVSQGISIQDEFYASRLRELSGDIRIISKFREDLNI